MAQWLGQFSGLTHESKLEDAEATLRTAVAAFRAASQPDVAKKAKAVQRLAARVLSLRVKLLKARLNANGPMVRIYEQVQRWIEQERAILAEGVNAILSEFGAEV